MISYFTYKEEVILKKLVPKAIKGDTESFTPLLSIKKENLYRIAYRYVHNEQDALDIIGEAVYKAYISISKLKHPEYFNTWLIRIVINCSINFINKSKKALYLDNEAIENLKDGEINILDETINKAISKEENYMKKNNRTKKRIFNGLVSVAVSIGISTLSINTSPSFAHSLEDIPVLGTLVNILQFNNGRSQGGKVTDGIDVDFISLDQENKSDIITINFSGFNKDNEQVAPHFNVEYKKAPYTMEFSISGVRGFSAKEYFEELRKSKYIKDVYELITLDDSQQRFNIVFNQPVDFKVEEYKNPAYVTINISENTGKISEQKLYSIRTSSYEKGEEFASLEEILFEIENLRIVKDNKGTYLYELGQYSSDEEARIKLKYYQNILKNNGNLYIEERTLNQVPKSMNYKINNY